MPSASQIELAQHVALHADRYGVASRDQAKKIIERALGVADEPIKVSAPQRDALRFAINFLRDYGRFPNRNRGGYGVDYSLNNESHMRKQRIEAADILATLAGDTTIAQMVSGSDAR